MPDFESEARYLARGLDQSRGDDVARRLSEDRQNMDPRDYSALLRRVAQYDQKGVGDDLVIVNQQDGSQEAFIRRAAIDVGMISPPPPPPGYYEQQGAYRERPRSNDGCTVLSAGAGAIIGNIFAPNGRRGAGTAAGAIVGGVIGNENCNR